MYCCLKHLLKKKSPTCFILVGTWTSLSGFVDHWNNNFKCRLRLSRHADLHLEVSSVQPSKSSHPLGWKGKPKSLLTRVSFQTAMQSHCACVTPLDRQLFEAVVVGEKTKFHASLHYPKQRSFVLGLLIFTSFWAEEGRMGLRRRLEAPRRQPAGARSVWPTLSAQNHFGALIPLAKWKTLDYSPNSQSLR